VRQAAALVRALAATSGDAAVRRAVPTYAGLLIASGLLFGGNGLEPVTVVTGAAASPLARALLWLCWLLVSFPALDAIWRTPSSFFLRSLPVPHTWHLAVLLTFSLLAEAPWALLWLLGGGPVAGLAALGGALALHAVLLARPINLAGLLLTLLALAAPIVTPLSLLSLGSWPIALVAFRRAWLVAPARGGHHPRSLILGPAPVALALAHLAGLTRGHSSVLLRAALLAIFSATAAWLAARNNAISDLAALNIYACGFFVPTALLAGSALSAPLLVGESRATWLLAATRTAPRTRLAAHTLAAALVGVLLATCVAAALALPWDLPPLAFARLLADLLLTGAALTTLSALLARWTARFGTRAAGRHILALLLAAILALALLARLGPAAPLAWTGLALGSWLMGHVLSTTIKPTPGDAPVLLTMTAIRKRLGTRLVLDGVDLTCPSGALTLVLGANGAGKSTLLRLAAGIVEPDAGAVHIAGRPLATPSARAALGYAPDTADAFPDLSVREVLALVAALKRAPPPPDTLRERLGLTTVWHQRLRTLSFGQVKRTWLLAALVGDPPLLILDEPSNGLDPTGAADLADLLRERAAAGQAALVSTNDAAFADRLGGTPHRLENARLTPPTRSPT
jgi:ABC-type Mn2+/Zn2+ transport system ATPase subunit